MKYVCINGAPRSGKDSFVECCKQILGERCFNVSSVDFVKHLAYECGWDGTKDLKNRKFLSDLKDLLTQWDDVPYNKIIEAVTNYEKDVTSKNIDAESCVAFIHVREPDEIQKLVDRVGAYSLVIRRDIAENADMSNHADTDVLTYKYMYTIKNNSTLDDLKETAKKFLKAIHIL